MNVNNPYFCKESTVLFFSGGRTSGYMLYKTIEAHGGKLPNFVKVCFANTGREMPQTLQFVKDCQDKFGAEIVWLEYNGRKPKKENPKKYNYSFKIVNFETAARNGEPFSRLIKDIKALPNPVNRACSGQLKVRTINRFLDSIEFPNPRAAFVGLRADEPRRAMKLHNRRIEKQDVFCPLYVDNVTKECVGDFWKAQNFDLLLPNNNGVTDLGNCDLCFLKSKKKRISIISQFPDRAKWWNEKEKEQEDFFDRGNSYQNLIEIASENADLFNALDFEDLPCFCGD